MTTSDNDRNAMNIADPTTRRWRVLSRQCDTCVFRRGNLMHLEPGRLQDLVHEALRKQSYVVCHETLPGVTSGVPPAICRSFYNAYGHLSQPLRWMHRLDGLVEVDPPQDSPFSPPEHGHDGTTRPHPDNS